METFSGLSRVRLAKSGAGGSQNKEEKCKPGVCKNTYVQLNVLAPGQKALGDTEALSPFVYLQIQDPSSQQQRMLCVFSVVFI